MATQAFGDRLDRWILKRGFRTQYPLWTLRLIEMRRMVADPVGYVKSFRSARKVTNGSQWADYIPKDSGYRLFDADAFPELPQVVAACVDVYRKHENELSRGDKQVNKKYFYNILTTQDLHEHPILLDFAISKSVVQAVTGYLGQVPRLASLGVFYSEINETVSGSQIFHVDGDALAQVKCFVNAWEVGPGGGAFTFISKRQTSEKLRNGGLLKTTTDDYVGRAIPDAKQITATGPAGSGVFVDTSRCLHQGSRAREHPRLVFQFQYVSRPDALIARAPNQVVPGGHLNITRRLIESIPLRNSESSSMCVN